MFANGVLEINQDNLADIKQIPKVVKEKNPLNEKPEINKKELEIQIHDLTNQYRLQNNLEPYSGMKNYQMLPEVTAKTWLGEIILIIRLLKD